MSAPPPPAPISPNTPLQLPQLLAWLQEDGLLDAEAQAALLERAKQIVAETKLPAKTWVKGIVSTL